MAERIIPIQIEGKETAKRNIEDVDEMFCVSVAAAKKSGSLPCNVEEEIPKRQSKRQIRIKPASEDKYLSKFSTFEKRDSAQSLPNADTPEKIVLVIDRGQEDEFSPFVFNSVGYSPLAMIKRAVNVFVSLKHMINPEHEFAILVLNENNASVQLDFTRDLRRLRDCINKISECNIEDVFNMNSVFEIIRNISALPQSLAPKIEPPYILRTIIFYGRSYTIPKLKYTEEIDEYLQNKYFTCDVLMTHEPVEISNHCIKIFGILQKLDTKGGAYFFPVARDCRKLHKSTARLLAHPLQRPVQKLSMEEE